jgi:hypothetical protein
MKIKLSNSQMMMAANVGVIRHLQFIKRNARPMYGLDVPTDWKLQIEGAMSEYALAKYLNVHWEGVGFPDADDVGNEDVRVTTHESGCLILHDRDKDDKKYWLLIGQNGEYEIKGYIFGRDGKQKKYWKEKVPGRPCYFVPQTDLIYEIRRDV